MTDAITLLTNDHREVEKLFGEYESSRDPATLKKICTELKIHTEIEERIVYPVVAARVESGEELSDQATAEHQEVKDSIIRVEELDDDDSEVEELFEKIKQDVSHHVEEEETEMFLRLKQDVSADRLEELGKELEAAKEQLRATM